MSETDDIKASLRACIATIEKRGVSQEHAGETVSKSEEDLAFQKIKRLVSVREQASEALRRRLVREGFSEQATKTALRRAVSLGLVDDMRFAEVLLRSRLEQGYGVRGITVKLEDLGIDISALPGWPQDYPVDCESEFKRALHVLETRPPRARNRQQAAYRRLVLKGFDSSTAASAARTWNESQ